MLRSLRNTAKLINIAIVLARHDALFGLEATRAAPIITRFVKLIRRKSDLRKGERLANALTELGPTFIKLGQALSTRSDLVGDEMAGDLANLQDKVPPFSTRIAKKRIEKSLGASTTELFEQFDDEPVAAASIAQVHFARTKQGREVAVKILRPGIEEAFSKDIDLFYWIADLIEDNLPAYRRMKPREMIETMAESVNFELDLRYEAAAAVELKNNTKHDEGFYVPDIEWSLTSEHILTSERIYGTRVSDIETLRKEGHDLEKIVYYAANIFFKQVFRDGFFHADPHPGNVFILRDGRIAVVDFGIMGRLDRKNRIFLAEILHGFLFEDYEKVARLHMETGIVPPHKSEELFALACRAIAKPILDKPLNEISVARLLAQLFQVSETFEMQLQPQFLLLQKTMMLTEGFGRMFKPDTNMWKLSEPMIMEWAEENLSAKAQIKHAAEATAERLKRLPEILDKAEKAIDRLNEAKLSLDPDTLSALKRRGGIKSALALILSTAIIASIATVTLLYLS